MVVGPVVVGPKEPSEAPSYGWAWSPDGRYIYYIATHAADDKTGIWRVPEAGGAARLMAHFDGPSRRLDRAVLRVQGNRFYFNLGFPQSDIWMTEVTGSR